MPVLADPMMQREDDLESGENDALLPGSDQPLLRGDEEKAEPMPQATISDTNPAPIAKSSGPVDGHSATNANTVAVPLEMLQKIIDFCAQTLRETSESKRILQDLERGQSNVSGSKEEFRLEGQLEDKPGPTANVLFKSSSCLSNVDDPARRQMIVEIWDNVTPWRLEEMINGVIEDTGEDSTKFPQSSENISTTRKQNRTQHRRLKEAMDDNKTWNAVYIHFLERRLMRSGARADIVAHCLYALTLATPDDELGHLLTSCYREGLFPLPRNLDSPHDRQLLFSQIMQLIECCIIIDNIYNTSGDDNIHYRFSAGGAPCWWNQWMSIGTEDRPILENRRSLEALLGVQISQVLQLLHLQFSKTNVLEGAGGDVIRIDDLDIRSLTSIGKLSIRWTEILEDHLKLNLSDMTLSVIYDCLAPTSSLVEKNLRNLPKTFTDRSPTSKQTDSNTFWHINWEIKRSWAVLFSVSGNAKKRSAAHDEYAPLKNVPDTLHAYLKNQHFGQHFEPGIESRTESVYRKVATASSNKVPIPYAQFPIFATRLRQLRHYMDSQKPRGLRQLWKDNRDSLNYYTFWGVIVFGGFSALLALFSLAVSVLTRCERCTDCGIVSSTCWVAASGFWMIHLSAPNFKGVRMLE